MKYNHAEAFCLMRYESDDHKTIEYIWNSRDGVTPFCVMAKDNKTMMSHTNWQCDECRPDHQPKTGDRIFIDMTECKAEIYREQQWHCWLDDPSLRKELLEKYKTKEAFIHRRSPIQKGEPDIIYFHVDTPPQSKVVS